MQNVSVSKTTNTFDAPAGKLVRVVLEDTFNMVMNIGANVENLVGDVVENAETIAGRVMDAGRKILTTYEQDAVEQTETVELTREKLIEDVPAWQDVKAGKPTACARCEKDINRGDYAHMGVSDYTGDRLFLCCQCFNQPGENQ